MASTACNPYVLVVRPGKDGEPGVIECRARPCRGVVARLARGREAGGNVVRVGRARVQRFVARIAVRGSGGEVTVYMATGASHRGVRSGQRERCVVVVESR